MQSCTPTFRARSKPYYQEMGRAGRDGRPASATLLWNDADVKTREFLIDRRDDEPGRPGVEIAPEELERRKDLERKKLRRMVVYADTTACLRATILRYFSDPAAREPCDACGNCERRTSLDADERLLVRKILSGIARAPVPYGRRKIAAMFVGHTEGLPDALARLSTTGLLSAHDLHHVEHWIDSACAAGLIAVSADQYRTLSLTTLGREVMADRVETVRMTVPRLPGLATPRRKRRTAGTRGPKPASVREASARPALSTGALRTSSGSSTTQPRAGSGCRDAVVDALRIWRLLEARRRAVAPFVILHDRTLVAIATALPRSSAELETIPGIGPQRLAAYGEAILSVVGSTVARSK